MGFLEEGAAGWSKGYVLAWGHGAAKPCEPEVLLPGPAPGPACTCGTHTTR